jgi:hypothetical protein
MRKLPVVLICRKPPVLPKTPNQPHIRSVPCPLRGALRDRHERWVRDAVDALATQDERCERRTAKSCGPDAPTLASSLSGVIPAQATVAKEPGHRGEHEVTVKTIARGKPGELAEPVVTMLVCFVLFRTRGCGCGHAPGFPCALCFSRVLHAQTRAYCAASMREHV